MANEVIICATCGSENVGQICIVIPVKGDDDALEVKELWEAYVCYVCEDDCSVETVQVN